MAASVGCYRHPQQQLVELLEVQVLGGVSSMVCLDAAEVNVSGLDGGNLCEADNFEVLRVQGGVELERIGVAWA